MAKNRTTCDVFLSFSQRDAALARQLADDLRANGLQTFADKDVPPGEETSDAVWEALAESRALLAIVSPEGMTPSMGIEIGAARAWNKPIFAIITESAMNRVPTVLTGIKLYPPERAEEVVQAIKFTGGALSEAERSELARIYGEIGVPVDSLLDPALLQRLCKRFEARTKRHLPGERLLSELLRMRKQGKLRSKRSTGKTNPRRSSA